jgi:flagellar hook protein FlgE
MNTAVSGLAAQSAAFGNISDNVANSQTVGFKGVNTTFANYLTNSTASVNDPGTVVATPQYLNTVQGTITQSTNPLALAVSGQGFFDVSQSNGTATNGATVFSTQQYFTRDGDFQVNSSGYLTNDAGQYLNGYVANSSGIIDKSAVMPIQVAQTVYKPVATQNMSMLANLPPGYHLGLSPTGQTEILDSTNTAQQAPTSQVNVYDSEGNPHQITLTWYPTATAANQTPPAPWMLSIADTTGGGNIPIMGAANSAADQKILGIAGSALTAATTALTKANTLLAAAQATQTSAQYTLTNDLTTNATALSPIATDVTAVQTARAAVANAAPTLNADKAALAKVAPGLMSDVTTVETSRAAVTQAQANVYQDQLSGSTNFASDWAALATAQTAANKAAAAFTAAATTADTSQPGALAAANQIISDWSAIDTANAGVVAAMKTLTATTTPATAAANQLIADQATQTTAQNKLTSDLTTNATALSPAAVAADITAVQTARAAVTTAASPVTADKAALTKIAPTLLNDVSAIDAARAAATQAQNLVYLDQLSGSANLATDQTALTTAQTAVTGAYTTLTNDALTADGGAAGPVSAAATQLITDWTATDTATATVATAVQQLATDVAAAATGTPANTTVTPAATTIVSDWNAIDTASAAVAADQTAMMQTPAAAPAGVLPAATTVLDDWSTLDAAANTVAADQTAVASAQAAVNTAQAQVNAAQTRALSDSGPVVNFGTDGTLQSLSYISQTTGKTVTIAASAANPNPIAELTFEAPYATATSATQPITLKLGNVGETNGLTQFAATSFSLRGLSQDGVPPGSFTGISTKTSGEIYANYDNGQTRLIAQVPLATFGAADSLQLQNGSAYTTTLASGNPSLQDAGTNGAGTLVTSSVESSNVDLASQFSQLIVAQQAYSANAKVVTTADQLMQATLNMKS